MSNESPKFSGMVPEQPIYYEENPTLSLRIGGFCDASGNPLPYGQGQSSSGYPQAVDTEFAGYFSQDGAGRAPEEYDVFGEAFYNSSEPEDLFGEADETSDTDFEPARQKANGFFVFVAVLLALALLGVSGYFGWDWYQNRTQVRTGLQDDYVAEEHPAFIAEQAVAPIFEALRIGNGDALLESWIDGEGLTEQERALMETAHYKNVEQRISSYKIRDRIEYIDEETARITVDVVQNGARQGISLTLKKTRVEYGFYPVWQVTEVPLVSPISVTVDKEVPEVLVNSVKVPLAMGNGKSTAEVRVLPGLYDIVVPESVPARLKVMDRGVSNVTEVQKAYTSKKETKVLKEMSAEPAVEDVKVEMVPSQFIKDQVQDQVGLYLDGCAQSRAADNQGCPFAYSGSEISEDLARNFSYEIVKRPVMDDIQVLEEDERRYVDSSASFQWGRVTSLNSGRVRKMWEFNTGPKRRPKWQNRDNEQGFSVDLDIIISGSGVVTVAAHQ